MVDASLILLRVLLDCSLRMIAIAAGIAGVQAVFCVRSAEVRYVSWLAAICAMVLMPILPGILPGLPVLPTAPAPLASLYEESPARVSNVAQPIVLPQAAPAVSGLVASHAPDHAPMWPAMLAAVYAVGVLAGLARFLAGWLAARRFARSLSPTRYTRLAPVYQSEFAGAPMTMGVARSKIVLPAGWGAWPADKLRAVFAHEAAHIRRRDAVVRCVAHLNRCFFWFHPLAWWLERRLAAAAEEVCDNAAARAIKDPRRYAAVLLDVADSVRRGGGRVSWQFTGVDGSSLEQRIDRLISTAFTPTVSWRQKTSVVLACAAVIATVAACAQPSKPLLESELRALVKVDAARRKSDDKVHSEMIKIQRIQDLWDGVRYITPEQASQMEARLAKNPEDINSRYKLMQYYSAQAGRVPAEIRKAIVARRRHIRELVEFHPDDSLASTFSAFINTQPPDPLADPEGYAEIRALWLEKANRPDARADVLSNAAYFLQLNDKDLARQFLRRAELQAGQALTARYAMIDAEVMLGATCIQPPWNDFSGNLLVLGSSPLEAHSPQADAARQELAASNDDERLTTVGRILLRYAGLKLDFDAKELGRSYLERAAALNPQSDAVIELARSRKGDRQGRVMRLPKDNRYEAAMRLSDRDRFELLGELAENSYAYGNSFDTPQRDEALTEWDKARKYASGLLAAASKFRSDPDYGNAILKGNVMLAFVSTRTGDLEGAVRYLRDSTDAPRISEAMGVPWERVCSILIDKGRSGEVIDFLERFAKHNEQARDSLLASAAELRNGAKPVWYFRSPS
jgi:beta-lactamase regulating signal transducer with metallopeptidase domain